MSSLPLKVSPRLLILVAWAIAVGGSLTAQTSKPHGSLTVTRNRIFFAGDAIETRLRSSHLLSNGDVLLTGSTRDLSWIGSTPRTLWPNPSGVRPNVPEGERIGFVLVASNDLQTLLHVYHFPAGAVDEVTRIRSTEVPGSPTGTVFISGRFPHIQAADDGYWISRLEGDAASFASGKALPKWSHFVSAQGFRVNKTTERSEGEYASTQPWDVRSDGRVIYVEGAPYWEKWSAMRLLEADGKPGGLAGWAEEGGSRFLALKPGRAGSLRSTTQADFDHRQEDENDNPGRKGRYPDDYYFTGPEDTRGRGYTGYRAAGSTQRVSPLAIDRRDNSLYFGTSTQTRLPNGNPDFEPAFIRLDADGRLVWWARGYREIERTAENIAKHQDAINSPPDQYVDQVAIDYTNDRVHFLARAHGGGVINFWSADKLVRANNQPGFLNNLHDTGNVHVSWLGAYGLADGKIHRSTWIAELSEGAPNLGRPFSSGKLAGWPRPNQGWTKQNTTRVQGLAIDERGRPAILATGRRPYTTDDALIENFKPSEGRSAWAPFARVYDPDLRSLDYSTLLRGPWDPETGIGGADLPRPQDIISVPGGLLVVGEYRAAPAGAESRPPRGLNAPAWGSPTPIGRETSALIFLLRIDEEDEDSVATGDMGSRPRSAY